MTQQTAIEWLAEQIKDYDFAPITNTEEYAIVIPVWIFKDKLNQAKAMEKEQMFAYTKEKQIIGEHTEKFFTEDFEQYYKQTYKTE